MAEKTLAIIPKSDRERIVVRLRDGGRPRADVRVATLNRKDKLRSTGAGFSIEPDALPHLIAALQRAHTVARAAGWCSDG